MLWCVRACTSPGRMSWTPRHRDAGTFLLCTCFHLMLTSREELLILGMFDVGTEWNENELPAVLYSTMNLWTIWKINWANRRLNQEKPEDNYSPVSHRPDRWPLEASPLPPPHQVLHCLFCPSCWRRLCVFAGPRCQILHQTGPGRPGLVGLDWAQQGAWGSRSNFLDDKI